MLDGLQLDPGKVLFVGDTVRVDIEGPRAADMKGLHVDDLVRMMGNANRSCSLQSCQKQSSRVNQFELR